MTQNYANRPAVGYAGMVVDTSLKDMSSNIVEGAAIAFGLAVGRGTAANTCTLGGAGFVGIAAADKAQPAELQVSDGYAVGQVAGTARKGTIWVLASTVVTVDAVATYTAATGVVGAGLAGAMQAGAKFLDAGEIGDLVRLYLP